MWRCLGFRIREKWLENSTGCDNKLNYRKINGQSIECNWKYKNVLWNATNEKGDPVSAGMYIYTIEANGFFASKKMILLK